MTTDTTINTDMLQTNDRLQSAMQAHSLELYHLTQVVKLAAFACEARRVLGQVENLCAFDAELEHRLSDGIEARRTWVEHDDSTSEVLWALSDKLQSLGSKADALAVSLPAAP